MHRCCVRPKTTHPSCQTQFNHMSDAKKKSTGATPTDAILESISDGVFTVDLDWRISSFNRAAETITGVSRTDAIGRRCSEVFRSSMCGADCALRQTLKTGKPVIGKSGYIIDANGNQIPISTSTAVLLDTNGRVIGGAETFRDLSEIEALRRKLEGRFRIGDLVSRSALMQRIFEALPAIAASPSTVLILGETGTGKDLVAQTIHNLSPRSKAPFVGCLYRCHQEQTRPFCHGRQRHPVSGRNRRNQPGPPGEAPAGSPGTDL